MNKFYPRGQDYDSTTSQRMFFEIMYYKNNVYEGEVKRHAYFKTQKKLEEAIKKMEDSNTTIWDVRQWFLPEGYNTLHDLAGSALFHESYVILLDGNTYRKELIQDA